MGNIKKNLFLALTFSAVIAIIVFLVQLIVINSGVEPRQPSGVIEGNTPDTGNENPGGEDPGDNNGDNTITDPTNRPVQTGQRNEILINSNPDINLIIYTRTELFNLIHNDLSWRFEYTGGGSAGLEIDFVLISPQGAAIDSEAFLNRHIGGTGAEYKGDQPIQNSSIKGFHVTASSSGVNYEAWIHQMSGSDLALALVINYSNIDQRDALYGILSSIDIE